MSPAAFLFGSCACRLLARTFLDYLESDVMTIAMMMMLIAGGGSGNNVYDHDDDDFNDYMKALTGLLSVGLIQSLQL